MSLDYPALAALAAVIREGGFERAAAVLGDRSVQNKLRLHRIRREF